MMKKLLSVFLVLFLSLAMVNIANSSDYEDNDYEFTLLTIEDVDINGNDMGPIDVLPIERGEALKIKVKVKSTEGIDNVKVKAEILGAYEWKDIEDSSDMFNMAEDSTYSKYLTLNLPEDMDANEEFTLKVNVFNKDYEESETYTLRIEAGRHQLVIDRVIFTPGLTLNVNQPLITVVRVENMGYEPEDSIYVSVSVPELGAYGATHIDELAALENEDETKTSQSSNAIFLPLSAQPGTYDLIVKVEYANGHKEITENYQLVIDGVSAEEGNVLVSATEISKSAEAGQGIVYSISIANMGSEAMQFTAEVNGLDWGNYRVDPIVTIVQAGSSSEMFVYVSPNEGVEGQKAFTVNVKEGNNVIEQVNFQANISEGKRWDGVLTGLEIGFVVLLIILVILGIILAATRMGKKDDEEPLGETYY